MKRTLRTRNKSANSVANNAMRMLIALALCTVENKKQTTDAKAWATYNISKHKIMKMHIKMVGEEASEHMTMKMLRGAMNTHAQTKNGTAVHCIWDCSLLRSTKKKRKQLTKKDENTETNLTETLLLTHHDD